MGYDCTLHAIDERAIAKAAGTIRGKSLAKIEKLIAAGDLDGAGHGITELALYQASTSGPHLAVRGIALSLWDERLLGKDPTKLAWAVERGPLASVVRRWPRLRHHLPWAFDENYCTGVFVPGAQVPALLSEVERRFAERPKGRIKTWVPLLRILRVAARHGLAYWEATDLAVRQGHLAWLAEDRPKPPPRIVHRVSASLGSWPRALACDGEKLVLGELEQFATFVIDLTRWPPRVVRLPIFGVDAAISRTGRIVLRASDDKKTMPRPFHIYELTGARPRKRAPATDVKRMRLAGEAVLCFPYRPGEVPMRMSGRALEPVAGLPRAVGHPAARGARHVIGDATHFADGTPIVIWDGSPYLARADGGFRRLARADLRPDEDCASLPLDEDHILTLRARRLVVVSRAGAMTKRFKRARNVMSVHPGPDGAVLLAEGDNDDDHVVKLWWPATKEYLGIDAAELGVDDVDWIVWARRPGMLVAGAGRKIIALDGAALLARPRSPER